VSCVRVCPQEYVPLGNVFQWLHAPKAVVTPKQQKKVALDTAKGMLYLHTRDPPIIHRCLVTSHIPTTSTRTHHSLACLHAGTSSR
jgi:hypothetical protein